VSDSDHNWTITSEDVYMTIYREHCKELGVHESFTCPDGNSELSYYPRIYTSWGFKNADYPLIRCIQTKESRHQKEWDYEYYICEVLKEVDDD